MAERRNRRDFTREEVLALLDYDAETGMFRWKIEANSHGGKIFPGDEAGTIKDGYLQIKIFGRVYRSHHLAWLIMTGHWPPTAIDIDHKDRNRAHNAWANLRLATRSQNNMNAPISKANTSGVKGVSWKKDVQKWHARIGYNNRKILLGDFINKDDAIAARLAAEKQYFGKFSIQGEV